MAANRDVEKFAATSEQWGWRRNAGRKEAARSGGACKAAASTGAAHQDAAYPCLDPLLQSEELHRCLRELVEHWKRSSIDEAVSSNPEATKLLARLVRLEHVVLSPCGQDIVRLFVRLMTTLRSPDERGEGMKADGGPRRQGSEALDAKMEAMKIRSEAFACERLHAAIRGVKHDSLHPLFDSQMGSLSAVEELLFDQGFSQEEMQETIREEALASLTHYVDIIDDEDSCYLLRHLGVILLHSSRCPLADVLGDIGEKMLRKGYTNRRGEEDGEESKSIVFILESAGCVTGELEVFLLANDSYYLWKKISSLQETLFSTSFKSDTEIRALLHPLCEAALQSPWVLKELLSVFDASLLAIRRQDYNIHRILLAVRQGLVEALGKISQDDSLHWFHLYPRRSSAVLQYFHRRNLFMFDKALIGNAMEERDVRFLKQLVFFDTALDDRLSLWVTCNHVPEMNEQLLSFVLGPQEASLLEDAMRLYAWLIDPLRSFDANMHRAFVQCRQLWFRLLGLQTREEILASHLLEQVADAIFEEPEVACAYFMHCILSTKAGDSSSSSGGRGSLMSLMCVLLYIRGGQGLQDMDAHTLRVIGGWEVVEALERTVKAKDLGGGNDEVLMFHVDFFDIYGLDIL
ncbi:hypothetical protein GUITHDRAFT_102786 [Guillardia theta CCMP2712]|uniref:Uncharacterized protein n=1 Tax=Guillardia theta (strain CCMP2712) TaxID=905079 RepID=L1JSV3_GUITC|nr:hypothetical protein GUITHDRAFT_102786 [Guillardia theta CCMP2712]EKX51522.1 hypothetical protein GUITHDRAFT_102786 [Guillardia theta CCMP2712]|eukprot:XP_005838502.1 hypothetical protein GUITHDRAFT_102786 [Guillardia theta CCMP2712]